MGLELTTDMYPSIMSQTRYPLRHAALYDLHVAINVNTTFNNL